MEFIEVSEGTSVKICEIESVTKDENGDGSIVRTHYNIYSSTFPYDVLLQLLEMNEEKEPMVNELEQKKFNIMKELGTPAW